MKITWHRSTRDEYLAWHDRDRKLWSRINRLIKDIDRGDEAAGIGKAEMLRGDLAGWSSRRIDAEHRLVYRILNDELIILQCRHHYR